ncbi:hypothetical protein E8E12_000205 [Didymella heteroderae]|uniref:Monooxygenase n=1 Tax=Didymella heteroderae TaxID=1769908 RepID=A0A9P4WFN7_9PLEO|nr:hypothetical protein E8E12_000205 [Didymella heteroderae]
MAEQKIQRTKTIIVGAGFGGLGMAIALRESGEEDFLILERFSDVGGVWRDNRYPGCTCDVPSHLYSFSFAPYTSRRTRYPSQQNILRYLQGVAIDYKVENKIRLNTKVSKASFQQNEGSWNIYTISEHSRAEIVYQAEIVIFATGQLHQPNYPQIPGLEGAAGSGFTGPIMHSAAWDHGIDLRNKRVSIIGTGSSAAQMLPALAERASEVTVYQREPHWVLPKPETYFNHVERLLLKLPGAHEVYRKALRHGADTLLSPIPRCRAWRYVVECYAKHDLRRQVGDERLVRKLMPSYPLGSKRILFDNDFYTALQRDNVKLITGPIKSVTENAVRSGPEDETQKDREVGTDVIILATGFRAADSLLPVRVEGRHPHCLQKDWKEGPEAFLGLAIWGYPNLFMIAGPNSFNPAGSNPDMKELQIAYIMRCLAWRKERLARTIEVKQRAILKYQGWLDDEMGRTVWSGSVNSWYKHPSGKVISPWPASRRHFKKWLRNDPEKFFDTEPGDSLEAGQAIDVDLKLEDYSV